ncbi:MAG: TIGR03086 family protein [Acidimicrobiaceae bacterium]|nr:TIGR03086 family protein [Acidimicrobiaceae bacterium]MCO5328756.1 TIGR03086 family metal-binding protein [Ilumatobacteraceae bacterium]
MSNEVIDRVTRLVQAFDSRVQAAPADAWGNQSPCDDWKARDVVVHVGNNLQRLGATLSGGEPREIGADEDIVAAWNNARDTFLGALPGADLSTTVPGPFGPMPAEQVIGRLVSTDVLVHTWDLARAVGGDENLDAEAVAGAYSGLKPMDAMIRQPGVFGAKVEGGDGDDLQTEFLKFLGRAV